VQRVLATKLIVNKIIFIIAQAELSENGQKYA
jgi:hypothetical protein